MRWRLLQYLEESIAQLVMSRDVLVFIISTVNTNSMAHPSSICLRDYAKHLDGLVLQGGANVSRCKATPKPQFGRNGAATACEACTSWSCCINLSRPFGRTLHQGIATDAPTPITHVNDACNRLHPRFSFRLAHR